MSDKEIFWIIWLSGFIPLFAGLLCAVTMQSYAAIKNRPSAYFTFKPKVQHLIYVAIIGLSIPFTYYVASIARPDGLKILMFWMQDTPVNLAIWKSASRYFPLRQTEYYLIYQWTDGINAYFTISLLQNILFLGFSLYFLKLLNIKHSAAVIFLYSTSSILVSFFSVIYPERNILLYMAIWGVSVLKWEQTKHWVWFFLAALTTQLSLYYKEPAILIFGAYPCVIAVTAILCKSSVKKHHLYLAAIITLICIKWFASFMYFIGYDKILGHHPDVYATPQAENAPYVFLSYIYHEPVTVCLIFISMTLMLIKLRSLKSVLSSTQGRLFYIYGLGGICYFTVLILFTLSARWYSCIPICALIYSLLCIEENPSPNYIKTRQGFLYIGIILNIIFSVPILSALIDSRVRTKALYDIVETQNIQSIHIDRAGAFANIVKSYYKNYNDKIVVTSEDEQPINPDLSITFNDESTIQISKDGNMIYERADIRKQTYLFLAKKISKGLAQAYINRATFTKRPIPLIGNHNRLVRNQVYHKRKREQRQRQHNNDQ